MEPINKGMFGAKVFVIGFYLFSHTKQEKKSSFSIDRDTTYELGTLGDFL